MLNLKAQKILLIEDYSVMRMSIKKMLFLADAELIIEAADAKIALAAMEKQKFDIILCDYNLGEGKNGQQLLEEAKYRKLLPVTTIFIMITAEQTQSMVLSAMENKPDEYLTKPFNAQQLLTRIEKQMLRKAYFIDIDQAIYKDNLPLAIAHCEKLLDQQEARMRTQLLKIGAELAINVGDFRTATHYYQEVLDQRELAWARLGVGIIAFLQNNFDDAIQTFKTVIQQAPMMMEPYDWLTKAYEATEKNYDAQETLNQAVELSPQAILRQQKLAILAEQAGDDASAKKAFKAAIKLGKFSVHKSCRDFSGLAKVYAKAKDTNDTKEALKLIKTMREEFSRHPEAELRAAHLEIGIHLKQNNKELADQAYAKIKQIIEKNHDMPKDLLLDIAEIHLLYGNIDAGDKLIEDLIGNYVDDENFINEVLRRYKNANKNQSFAEDVFKRTKEELIKINNQGVNFFKQGNISAAFELLDAAYIKMPNNKIIIMNLAKILMRDIKASGITNDKLSKINTYLSKAATLGISQDKTGIIKMELAKLIGTQTNL